MSRKAIKVGGRSLNGLATRFQATMERPKDGDKFNRLTVVGDPFVVLTGARRDWHVRCRCDCGNEKRYRLDKVVRNCTLSCGCLKSERIRDSRYTHGDTGTRLYHIWAGVVQRAANPDSPAARHYAARGITLEPSWLKYESFRDWALANGYEENLSIDRRDVNGPYSPENCRWTTMKVQQRNRRNSIMLTAFGETKNVADWAEDDRCQVSYRTLKGRIGYGWDHASAITTPLRAGRP